MKKLNEISYIAGLAVSIMLLSPVTSEAAVTSQTNDVINAAVENYGQQIQESYAAAPSVLGRSLKRTQTSQLAQENGQALNAKLQGSLNVHQANVSTQVISSNPTNNGYEATVDIVTSLNMTPNDGTTITIAGQKQDSLDSSATFRHVLDLEHPAGQSGTPLTVVKDKVQLDDDGDQTNPVSMPSQSSFNSRTQTSVRSASYNTDWWATNHVGLDWLATVKYAELWTDSNHVYKNHEQDFMNFKYPVFKDNCTNFVSQALHEAGLKTKNATVLSRTHDDVWSYEAFAQLGPTYTWGGAENNYRYMKNYSDAFSSDNNPTQIGPGSIIYADWDGNGTKDHAAVVVGNINTKTTSIPVICQKTHNEHDEPLTTLENYAQQSYHGATKWYGLQWDW